MQGLRNALVLTLPLALGPPAALSQSPPQAPPPPLRVTTDTPEYCDTLAGRIAAERQAHPRPMPEVQQLAQEGQHMCDTGLVRAGLLRLRRAWLMLEAGK
jgi:hypothetical protein